MKYNFLIKIIPPRLTPSPSLLQQEPGVGDEILNGVEFVRPGGGFKTAATLFQKTQVNGDGEDPIFTYLKVHIYYIKSL